MSWAPDTVLCGVEDAGDAAAVRVAEHAAALADRLPARLVLIQVLPPQSAEVTPMAGVGVPVPVHLAPRTSPEAAAARHAAAAHRLDELAGRLHAAAEILVTESADPEAAIAEVALERTSGLIVIGTHGGSPLAALLSGSVSARLPWRCPWPLALIPPEAPAPGPRLSPRGDVVCAYDGSDAARRAARVAAVLAARWRSRIVLLHVAEPDEPPDEANVELTLRRAAIDAAGYGTQLEILQVRRSGEVGEVVRSVAEDADAPVVVAGSRGYGVIRAALLGSASRRIVACAERPVVVVPPTAEDQVTP